MYPCNHQDGEMHKRRPAVVVKVDSRGVTVVPITSKEPVAHEYNRAIFELEVDSIRDIKELDTGKRSFAVCEMIQTVSLPVSFLLSLETIGARIEPIGGMSRLVEGYLVTI